MPITIDLVRMPWVTSATRYASLPVFWLFTMSDGLAAAEISLLEEVVVVGVETDLRSISGSAAILSEEDLEAFDYVDLGKLLSAVPGVYGRG